CRLGTCHDLFGNCDGVEDNGCEQDLSSDPNRCGDCDLICDLAQAQAICVEGSCQVEACEPGWGDCDQLSSNGCEADFDNSNLHCGGCDMPCEQPNTVSRCEEGSCRIDACIGSFRDCNQDATDGCEADMISDPANCGSCGHDCSLPQTQVVCEDRICVVLDCNSGFGDCNNLPEDGCEQDLLSSLAHCGGCNTNCQPEHAEANCLEGLCEIDNCDPGWGNCNLNTPDGCETDLSQNDQHCGTCGTICPRGSTCINGLCGGDCMDADQDGHFAARGGLQRRRCRGAPRRR
ncbi:MAG: hypothetical protein JRF33_21975, partial [Deltaproteobacteria bacterium]|nr:hypothetical protein [Deltaproteobacteria bacterium]